MYDAKREWLFLSDLEIDTNSAWLKTSLEMLKRPQEILVDDIRRAVEHEYVLRRCASWLERKILENEKYDMDRLATIFGRHPERNLAMYEAQLKHKETLVRYLCLRIAGNHTKAEELQKTVQALQKESEKARAIAYQN